MISSMQIGQRIGEGRRNRGITQLQLATETDVSRQYINEIENGKASCTLDTVQRIAKAIGLSLSKLMDLRVPESWDDPKHQEIHNRLQRIMETDKEASAYTDMFIAAVDASLEQRRRSRVSS